MKTNSTKNWMKVAGLTLAIGTFAFTANAQNSAPVQQTTITNAAAKNTVTGNGAGGAAATAGGAVRLVDNKGTIKYLQVQNGITQITNTTTSGVTTTWQLGGTLTDNTYITTGDGTGTNPGRFALDGLQVATGIAATTGTLGDVHGNSSASGWTVLVRNENTGAIEKMLASDLLQVQAGEYVTTASASTTTEDFTPTGGGLPSTISKIYVYRNGAKLVGDVLSVTTSDYTIDAAGTIVTLKPSNTKYGEWALYDNDVIEIHWIK